MALPGGISTHCHNVTKQWSRLDHVFISEASTDAIITCNAQTDHRGINTDHIPIITELNMGVKAPKALMVRLVPS